METRSLADSLIRDHAVYAMGAAAIPIPAFDIMAVTVKNTSGSDGVASIEIEAYLLEGPSQ